MRCFFIFVAFLSTKLFKFHQQESTDFEIGRFYTNSMIVYADLLFLFNLAIDFVLLLITAWVLRVPVRKWRVGSAAAFGASYVLLVYVPILSEGFHFIGKIIISMIMVWMAFGFERFQRYGRLFVTFYVVNFVAAGGVMAVNQLLASDVVGPGGVAIPPQISMLFVLGVGFPVTLVFRQVVQVARHSSLVARQLVSVQMVLAEHCVRCVGLVDTGHHLREPFTGKFVLICELDVWKARFPSEVVAAITDESFDALQLDWRFADRLRLIPYTGISRGTQLMIAIRPDSVTIDGQVQQDVLVGFKVEQIHKEKQYQAIVHPGCLHT
jgi:stage II sporulation protein GA (sporulation sigma-E factor processing peptidase)